MSFNIKILITGSAGFIGSNLCGFFLEKGFEVIGLDNLSNGTLDNMIEFFENTNFTFVNGDIRDLKICLESTKNIDYVFHQAAWGSVPRSIELPLLYEEINVIGTLNMLEASRQNSVKRFIYASSSSVYGDEPTLPKKEGFEGNLLSPYALTKLINEEYAKLYSMHYGLETIGLRYFNVFGQRQDPYGDYAAVIPRFIKQLLNNEQPLIYGNGKQSRDFTYIDNVLEANYKAYIAPKNATGKVYNIAFGGQETILDVYNTLCELLKKDVVPIFLERRISDIVHSNADISLAKKYLKYEPKYSFRYGIMKTIDWYKLMAINEK